MKAAYSEYVKAKNADGSNKASSYIRALDLLGPILADRSTKFSTCSDVWLVQSVDQIDALYRYIIEQQKLGDEGVFETNYKPSYWRSGFYSAALNSLKQFLILSRHEQQLWDIYHKQNLAPDEISARLTNEKIVSIEALVADEEVDFKSKEGREVVREVKARIGQDFFRKMILSQYQSQCCVTGLNIPQVLRASHITSWADDKKNRLNPANGLCLSATYDAAFDRHLISFDDKYRMILSPSLKENLTNEAFQQQFKKLEGSVILKPQRFLPDKALLEKHRSKMLA